jgi:ABC-type sugar transport system ATPase subunit
MAADTIAHGDVLAAEGLSLAPGAATFDDRFSPGEIVGLAGLEGQGQEVFLEALCGLRHLAAGRVSVEEGGVRVPISSFRQAVRRGVAYVARDRRANGIFPSLSILDNFGLVSMGRDVRFGFIDRRRQRARYETYRRRLTIVAPSPDHVITTLSGGNQQKVLLARWLALGPRVLLLNDPTRGVDQRTRETLYQVFRELAHDEGMALVILSTEIEELLRLCGRVLVFRDQRVVARLAEDEISHNRVIAAMFGQAA